MGGGGWLRGAVGGEGGLMLLYTNKLTMFQEFFSLGVLGKLAGWDYTYRRFLNSKLLGR